MEEILSKKHYRRTFYIVVLLILALAIVIRFLVLPQHDSKLSSSGAALFASLLDNLVISLFLTVFIGSFIFWLRPEIVKKSTIEVIDPKQINPLLKKATTDTRFWIYKGACGRFTRATTLPKMAEAAKNEGIGRDIRIYLLSPKNEQLCTEYATYRRSLKSASNSAPWTCEKVQEEVIATAISAMKYQYSEPLLRISIFFVDHFSAFRLDICDQYVVVTKEDKEASALKADSGTYFYNSYKDDVRLTERQSTEIKCCGKLQIQGELSDEMVQDIIKCADLIDETLLGKISISNIRDLVNTPADPY